MAEFIHITCPRSTKGFSMIDRVDLIIAAAQCAATQHAGQVRKYNGRPYITHPIRVAGRVAIWRFATPELVAAAYLHDVVEDCDLSLETIGCYFGPDVMGYVSELTNVSKNLVPMPNRAERKRLDIARVATISVQAKFVKLIDRIDNLREIDPEDSFATLYARESLNLLTVLQGVDEELENELRELAEQLLED